jgi:predicted metalloprotease with PDZ domain
MNSFRTGLLGITLLASFLNTANAMNYTLTIPDPTSHYAEITLSVPADSAGDYIFSLPVWTPGSYLVREFSKSIEQVAAFENGRSLNVEKIAKNKWKVQMVKPGNFVFTYKVYCFEFSARTSFIDAEQALINGASVFMFVEGMEDSPGKVDITLPKEWKSYISSLKDSPINGGVRYSFLNYDILIDAPIQLGNFEIFEFSVLGIPHYVAMVGTHNAEIKTLKTDMQKMCQVMAQVVGEFPKDIEPFKYVFIVQNVASGGGGIEHLNSTVLIMPRFNYTTPAKYRAFLSLVAHEYFHLWNVKRIRPVALGPFNYHEENYTKSLWIAEGITSYYDELALLRAGYVDPNHFLEEVSNYINGYESRPGSKFATLHETSFDAWIGEYRPNENSKNTSYSYYAKGFIIAALLDAKICLSTNGKKSLDDVFKKLYADFYGAKKFGYLGTGYTDEEFLKVCNDIAGERLDTLFEQWLETTNTPNYGLLKLFKDLSISSIESQPYSFHIQTKNENGKTLVTYVNRWGAAQQLGVNVNDELISLNGFRIHDNLDMLAQQLGKPKSVALWISRNGKMQLLKGPMKDLKEVTYSIRLSGKSLSPDFWQQTGSLQHWLRKTL